MLGNQYFDIASYSYSSLGDRVRYFNMARPLILLVNSGNDGVMEIKTNIQYSYGYDLNIIDMSFTPGINISFTPGITSNHIITFPNLNTDYVLEIRGNFPHPLFINESKIKKILQFGDVLFRSFSESFRGCVNLIGGSFDTPKMVQDISLVAVFYQSNYNGKIGDWDWAKVKQATNFARENASFDQDISNIDLSSLESGSAQSFQLVLQMSSSFTNGGNRLTLDFMDKTIILGSRPFNLLKVKEYHFKRARNISWASFLQTDPAGRDLVEALIIEDYDKSLNWVGTSYNYKNLTPQGVKEMIDSVDITAGQIMRLDSGVYNAFDLYVQTLGYIDIQDYLTQSGNTWTITT